MTVGKEATMYAEKINDETRRAIEQMVLRVVARELATTSIVQAVPDPSEFEIAYQRWTLDDETVVQDVADLSITQEMPCWVEEDLVYQMHLS
jgi:hypothetical protein